MTTDARKMSISRVVQVALKVLVDNGGKCTTTEIGQELRRYNIPYTGTLKKLLGGPSPYVRSS